MRCEPAPPRTASRSRVRVSPVPPPPGPPAASVPACMRRVSCLVSPSHQLRRYRHPSRSRNPIGGSGGTNGPNWPVLVTTALSALAPLVVRSPPIPKAEYLPFVKNSLKLVVCQVAKSPETRLGLRMRRCRARGGRHPLHGPPASPGRGGVPVPPPGRGGVPGPGASPGPRWRPGGPAPAAAPPVPALLGFLAGADPAPGGPLWPSVLAARGPLCAAARLGIL